MKITMVFIVFAASQQGNSTFSPKKEQDWSRIPDRGVQYLEYRSWLRKEFDFCSRSQSRTRFLAERLYLQFK